jgi:hypothetical protein
LEEREDWNTSVPLSYCWKKPLMTQGQLRVWWWHPHVQRENRNGNLVTR